MTGNVESESKKKNPNANKRPPIVVDVYERGRDLALKYFTIAGAVFVIAGTIYQWGATKKSLAVSREAIANDHRPWALGKIESIEVPVAEATVDAACRKGVKVTASLKNYGEIPATDVLGIVRPLVGPNRVSVDEVNIPRIENPTKLGLGTFLLAPNDSIPMPDDKPIGLPCDDFAAVLRGTVHLYLVFNVWYRSAADQTWHASSSCIMWNRETSTSFDRCGGVERAN